MSADPAAWTGAPRRVADLANELEPYHLRYEAGRDSRAVFAYIYANITHDLATRLADPQEDFDDPGWVADLAVAFGERFVAAMDAIDEWERTNRTADEFDTLYEAVPRPWADVHRAIGRRPSTVLEDLVFGMTAHITYDLPNALCEVDTHVDRLRDYHRMNDVLASRADAIKVAVTDRYNRTLGYLDRLAGETDDLFTNFWIRMGRSVAWYNAMRLQSPRSRAAARQSIERSTAALIESVRAGGPRPIRWGSALYRTVFYVKRRWPTTPSGFARE